MKVLSLFDGMSCGMLAMLKAGVKVDRYVAYEIDKYAVRTSSHNFPMIEQRGDVFQADFTEFAGFDWLVGGSPCTYWSIAQTKNRETVASGMGWELFSQYVRALHEAKPKYFIYENNKSMSKAIRASIDETFGFEAVCINSALVSAQNRQRLYWVGKRNPDGTYSKVDVEQPEDRGILLRDILEDGIVWAVDAEKNTVAKSIDDIVSKKGYLPEMFNPYNRAEITTKSPTLSTGSMVTSSCAVLMVETADGKQTPIYKVRGGLITINGKQYPIKLKDGYYIIRKLTVSECKRLQTVPEWYEFPVSDSQACKMLGNGWTVDVIAHILKCLNEAKEEQE